MIIEGPLKIEVIDNDQGSRELHLDFTDEFRSMNQAQQSEAFHEFILYLKGEIGVLEDKDPNRKGMLMIAQISEQLLPHIEANEIPLEETVVVNLEVDNPFGNITQI
jgi:hypothetical protein